MILQGGCFCGAIRYEAQGPAFHATLCHCDDCRRATGAPAVAWFSVESGKLRYLQGEPTELRSSPQVTRAFCGRCGTQLTYRHDLSPDETDITTCSLDNPELAPPQDHTFASHRVRWLEVCDRLPAFPRTRADGHGAGRAGQAAIDSRP
jgi:hypothetical protein